jgi:hypothetical protein
MMAACGGRQPDDGNGAEGGSSGDESTATTPTTGMSAGSVSMSAGETDDGSSGAESADSSGGASGSTGAGDDGPGIELGCMGMGPSDPDDGVICFYDVEDPGTEPAANMVYKLVELDGKPAIYLRLIFAPWFADNTYGVNAIGWPGGHKFDDLVGSDHAQFVLRNVADDIVMDFLLDYIDDDDTAPSGYRARGVWEGEGKMELGDETAILAANSSISRNLNERGYVEYLEDSPATDENYTPNPAAPAWDYRVVYEVWIDAAAFDEDGDGSLAEACVQFIHASPSKLEDNTKEVIPDECPPGWGCFAENGCQCESSTDPDHFDDCDPGSYPPEG